MRKDMQCLGVVLVMVGLQFCMKMPYRFLENVQPSTVVRLDSRPTP